MKTIFEKIIDREIPADIIYEDDTCIVFLDIAPVTKGHLLVVSRSPYPWVHDVPLDIFNRIMKVTHQVIHALKNGLSCDYVQIGIVGTEVPHFHIHLIPQMISSEENMKHERPSIPYKDELEKQEYVLNIKKSL